MLNLLERVNEHLAKPMPDDVFWHLIDDFGRMAHLDPSHRRTCVYCKDLFYVTVPSGAGRYCSGACYHQERRERMAA